MSKLARGEDARVLDLVNFKNYKTNKWTSAPF